MAIQQRFWMVYKTTQISTGYEYIGVHLGTELDSYLGSGTLLKRFVARHGRQDFYREILFRCETSDEAYRIESELVNEEWVRNPYTFNLTLGGKGSAERRNSEESKASMRKPKSEEHRKAISAGKLGIKLSESHREAISNGQLGKVHSEATKGKMSKARSGKVHNLVECPHCGKIGGAPAMGQWHFNNCKFIGVQ